MLKTIQIITLIQGLFLLIAIVKNREHYLKVTFYLLLGTIISVILYLFGNNNTSFTSYTVDIFLFDKSLFITCLFLFIKYYISKSNTFSNRDYLFFIPNILFFIIELLEIIYSEGLLIIDSTEIIVELTFLGYLLASLINLTKIKKPHHASWMLFFIIPLIILIGFSILDEILYWFHLENALFSFPNEHFGEYTIVIIAVLFYTITLKLIISPDDILIKNHPKKYKNSSLNLKDSEDLKSKLLALMENDKIYSDPKLSIQKISEVLGIPRQYISEVLNIHMHTNFQDFVNSYRIEAFINALRDKKNEHFSLLGIAKNMGFNSKTSFNTSFKKLKEMTPSQYKEMLVK